MTETLTSDLSLWNKTQNEKTSCSFMLYCTFPHLYHSQSLCQGQHQCVCAVYCNQHKGLMPNTEVTFHTCKTLSCSHPRLSSFAHHVSLSPLTVCQHSQAHRKASGPLKTIVLLQTSAGTAAGRWAILAGELAFPVSDLHLITADQKAVWSLNMYPLFCYFNLALLIKYSGLCIQNFKLILE